jgi:lysozyme family protein
MTDLAVLTKANAARWNAAKLTKNFVSIAKSLVAAKNRYQAVESKTRVPWFVIAVIHEREASQRWDTQLGQGDQLDRVSVHVPAGRGPFKTWEDGACDALINCGPYAARNKDWSVGGVLTLLERYNGLGYANHDRPSPYVWAGTDQYVSGKYVRDGVYDPGVVDPQPGCAALIKTMMVLDRGIVFGAPVIASSDPAPAPTSTTAPASFWSALFSFIISIFRKGK